VIHVVGPNHAAGQRDPALLESCYRNALRVADELGAGTLAFPLVSAGIYGWPKDDAIRRAISSLRAADAAVLESRLVAFDAATHATLLAALEA